MMFRLKDLVVVFAICIFINPGWGVLSLGLGSVDDSAESLDDPPDRKQEDQATHHSDVLSMLGKLKGGDELKTMETLLSELSVMKTAFSTLVRLTPLYQNIFEEAAKKNPALRVVLKASKGQFPDLKDIYDLTVNSRKKDMISDVFNVEKDNKQFKELSSLIHDPSTVQSASALRKVFNLWFGTDINFDQKVVTALYNGNLIETKKNLAQANIIYFFEFFVEGSELINETVTMFPKDQISNMLMAPLKKMAQLDVSKLSQIKVMQVETDKYKITGGTVGFLPDPDVTKILDDSARAKKMSKQREINDSNVIKLCVESLKNFEHLLARLLHDASTQSASNHSGQPSMA